MDAVMSSEAVKRESVRDDLVPLCDGKPWKGRGENSSGTGLVDQARKQFVAIHHQINSHYAKLRAGRIEAAGTKADRGEAHRRRERQVLRRIEKALLTKETLENHYAARGISVTAIYRDGFTIDLRLQHPGAPKFLVAGSSASRFVTLELPVELE